MHNNKNRKYKQESEISYDDIKEKITANGQNATKMEVLDL